MNLHIASISNFQKWLSPKKKKVVESFAWAINRQDLKMTRFFGLSLYFPFLALCPPFEMAGAAEGEGGLWPLGGFVEGR